MITFIEIENFRCFKKTKIGKFKSVNLIGGLNNTGKTALLEAVYLAISGDAESVAFSYQVVRNETTAFAKDKIESTWDNFFYQQDKTQPISLNYIDNNEEYGIILTGDKKVEDVLKHDFYKTTTEELNQIVGEKKSVLHVSVNSNDLISFGFIAGKSGFERFGIGLPFDNAHFFPTSMKFSSSDLAHQYDTACYSNKSIEDKFLKGIQLIDASIIEVKSFTIGGGILCLQRENENMMPITLFGDAINRIAYFILRIITRRNTVILIDEIENGIHYTKQAELWDMLFKLAIEYNVQIFSTSHSLEMIRAFANVAKQFPEQAAYFEMARHAETGNIIGTPIPIDILQYDIENNAPFRGE